MNQHRKKHFNFHKLLKILVVAGALLPAVNSCKKSAKEPPPVDNGKVMSYRNDIQPIMANHCYSCHSAAATDPESPGYAMLDNFDELKNYALKLSTVNPSYTKLQARLRFIEVPGMPFKKAPLNDSLIKKIDSWVKAGAPNN